MKIPQIGCDRRFSKYLMTSNVDAANLDKMHVRVVCLLSDMSTDCSHPLFQTMTLIQCEFLGTDCIDAIGLDNFKSINC